MLANDTDDDGNTDIDATSVAIVSGQGPTNGSVSVNSTTGEIIYTPNANFNGTDTFQYTVDDQSGTTSNAATVTVNVNSSNDAPTGTDDSASTTEDTAVTIDVLANDTDDDGDVLTITNLSTPAHGTASINAGKVVYTPNANFNGTDTFTYTPNDGTADGNTTTVTVTISAVNDNPVANGSSGKYHFGKSGKKVCKDSRAINFSNVGQHDQSLCKYKEEEKKENTQIESTNQTNAKKLGYGYACPKDM